VNFKLAVVGHCSSIREIEAIIGERFQNVDVFKVDFGSDLEADRAQLELERILPHCNAVLYTRIDPWKIMSSRLEHAVPVRYVDVDASNLVHSLLEACYHLHADILRPSIDSLSYNVVINAYNSVGIREASVSPQLVSADANDENFTSKVEQAHRFNYEIGLCSFCVTNVRSVHNNLVKGGIPSVLLAPSAQTYIYEIRRLIVSHSLMELDAHQIVMVAISLQPRNDFYLYQKTILQEVLDQNKAKEYIALFAQRAGGALITLSSTDYLIVCGNAELEELTEQYSNIDLLCSIPTHTCYGVAMGIGYDKTPKVAKAHAEVGLQRSLFGGGSQAHIVYTLDNVVGPIEPNEIMAIPGDVLEQRLERVAKAAGLSMNTIYRIDCFAQQKKGKIVTSIELAEELGVSVRTSNRIVSKLEQCSYVAEVGKHLAGKRGRPTRMLKVLF